MNNNLKHVKGLFLKYITKQYPYCLQLFAHGIYGGGCCDNVPIVIGDGDVSEDDYGATRSAPTVIAGRHLKQNRSNAFT